MSTSSPLDRTSDPSSGRIPGHVSGRIPGRAPHRTAIDSRRAFWGRAVWLGAGLLVGAAVAHFGYWYTPRLRPVDPESSPVLRRVAQGQPDPDVILWIPFPHQNLPALGRQLDQPAEVLLAAARLAGADIDGLPRLGGFGLPPARELVVATSLDGRRAQLALRPYPLLRLGGRAAGVLASNPWLEGGVVELSQEEAQVSWQRSGTWVLSRGTSTASEVLSQPIAGASGRGSFRSDRRSLGRIELRARGLAIPAGVYDLTSRGFGFRLASGLGAESGASAGSSSESGLDVLSTVEELAVFRVDGGPSGVMLLVFAGELRRGELPSAAVISTDQSAALAALPGSRLLGSLGDLPSRDLESGAMGGVVVVATDNRGLDLALAQRVTWEPIWKAARSERASGFWVDLQRAESIAGDTADLFEDVPLVPRREARRWRDIHTVVRGFRAFRVASAWWTPDGGALSVE